MVNCCALILEIDVVVQPANATLGLTGSDVEIITATVSTTGVGNSMTGTRECFCCFNWGFFAFIFSRYIRGRASEVGSEEHPLTIYFVRET